MSTKINRKNSLYVNEITVVRVYITGVRIYRERRNRGRV